MGAREQAQSELAQRITYEPKLPVVLVVAMGNQTGQFLVIEWCPLRHSGCEGHNVTPAKARYPDDFHEALGCNTG